MWRWVLRAVFTLSRNPAVQEWARRRAYVVIDKIRARAERRIAALCDVAERRIAALYAAVEEPKS